MMDVSGATSPVVSSFGRGGCRVADRRRLERLWRLVALGAGDRSFSGWAGVVCQVVVDEVDVDGAAIAAIAVRPSSRTEELVAVTDGWARNLEELQYTVGEGPGVDAYESGGPVLVSDLAAARRRWPGFTDVVAEELGAVFAFPLQEGTIRLGTLTLYRRRSGALAAEQLSDIAVLADLATRALLVDTGSGVGGVDDVAPWAREDATGHYDDVNVATGMLAAELRISIEDALLRLRAHAFSQNQPLLEVARAVQERRLDTDVFAD
jgi:hypothetical protein